MWRRHSDSEKQLPGCTLSAGKVRVKPRSRDISQATVTVVIPCYNYARYLPSAVGSALSQSDVLVDVIIVDDASTDRSLEAARELAADDPRIQVIAHAKNSGPVQTFNDALPMVRGEFLVRLDADDLLTPGSLKRSISLALSYPSVGLVYGHPLHFSGSELPPARGMPTAWTIWSGRQWLSDRCRSGYNVITSPEALMRTSVVEELGGQKHLDHTHDMEMWLRMAAFSDVAYIHGADQAWHREHDQSLSSRKVDTYRDLIERRSAFEVLFEGPAAQIPDAEILRTDAMQSIAAHALEAAIRLIEKGNPDLNLVDRFIQVARTTVPNIEEVPGWRSLEKGMALGPEKLPLHPATLVRRSYRKVQNTMRWRNWHQNGVF